MLADCDDLACPAGMPALKLANVKAVGLETLSRLDTFENAYGLTLRS
jgi:hypothetical protein